MRETSMQRCRLLAGGKAHIGHALLCERVLALNNHFQAAVCHHGCKLVLHAQMKINESHVGYSRLHSNEKEIPAWIKPEFWCCS